MKHTAYIAGAKFRGADSYVKALPDGASFTLEAEPTNEHDPNAVKVLHDGLHVGYVPRDLSAEVAKLLEQGRIGAVVRAQGKLIIEFQ